MINIPTVEKPGETPPERQGDARIEAQFEELQKDVLGQINFGSSVPLSEREAKHVEEKTGKRTTIADVEKAFKEQHYGDALKKLFCVIFGDKYAVQGLGYLARNIDAIPQREQMGLLGQLSLRRQKDMDIKTKLTGSIVRAQAEMSLRRKGYEPLTNTNAAGKKERVERAARCVEVAEGSTLKDCVTDAKVRKEMFPDAGEAQVIGSLSTDTKLPKGWLYLSAEGYPLFFSREKMVIDRCPRMPLFRKMEKPGDAKNSEEQGIEFLEQHLQRGDILLVSQAGEREKPLHFLFQAIQRLGSRTRDRSVPFHATHVLVYDGTNVIHTTAETGVERKSPREMFKDCRYNAITVARVPEEKQEAFAAKFDAATRMENGSGKDKEFNKEAFVKRGMHQVLGTEDAQTSTPNSCICVDVVTDAAKGVVPTLAQAKTPEQVALCPDVELAYSLEMYKD